MAFEAVPTSLFEDFVRGYGDKAFQFAYRLCGSAEESKELVQDAFARLLAHWGEHDPARPVDAWFFRILHNVAVDAVRRRERRRLVSLDAPIEGGQGDDTYGDLVASNEDAMLEALERRGRGEAVHKALEGISQEHRNILVLCDMEGRAYEEIARVLAVPLGTVRSRVSRARLAFRRALSGNIEVTP